MKKSFLDALVLVFHICSYFLQEEQIVKKFKWGHPRDPLVGRPGDNMVGHSKDVRGTSVIHAF